MEPEPIKKKLFELQDSFDVVAMGYDGANFELTLGEIVNDLKFETNKNNSTGYKLSATAKELKSIINGGELRHDGNKILTWMIDNVTVKENEDENIKLIRSGEYKSITGITALELAMYEHLADKMGGGTYDYQKLWEVDI